MIKDYLKAVYHNKFTLLGYLGILTVAGIETATHLLNIRVPCIEMRLSIEGTLAIGGSTSLLGTGFGATTMKAYRRTKEHIQNFGRVGNPFKEKLRKNYCNKVGVRMAVREAGLEDII